MVNLVKLARRFAVIAIAVASDAVADDRPMGEILYCEETRRGRGNLVVLNLDSGEKRRVGESGSRSDHFPSWSPDGRRFVFESYRRGGWHVWVSGADGDDARRLSNLIDYSTASYEFDPSFAPDNRTVVFVYGDDLWTVTLDDPSPRRLSDTADALFPTAPVYSPDGEWVAIAGRDARTREWDVYTMRRDGTELRQLTHDGASLAPRWSPDGSRILFYSSRDGSFELHEMSSAGDDAIAIFDEAELDAAGFEPTAFIDPWDGNWGATEQYRASYSPDGAWIVFSREIDGDRELFACRRDGSELTRLTRREGLDGQPAWRPNRLR